MTDAPVVRPGQLRHRTAEEIRVLLARRRMNATQLARLVGMKQPYISRRMTGEIAFDLDDLELIAAALGVRVVDLLPEQAVGVTPPYPIRSLQRVRVARPSDTRPANRADGNRLVAA